MPLRTFRDLDGAEWRVWSVVPDPHAAVTLDAEHRAGWLCFERLDGRERRRLTLAEAPADWDALPEDRLELLRRVATVSAPPLLDGPPEATASP